MPLILGLGCFVQKIGIGSEAPPLWHLLTVPDTCGQELQHRQLGIGSEDGFGGMAALAAGG